MNDTTKREAEEIIGCPICGCAPLPVRFSPARDWTNIYGDTRPGHDSYSIQCRGRDVNNYFRHFVSITESTKEKAIANWNTRASLATPAVLDDGWMDDYMCEITGFDTCEDSITLSIEVPRTDCYEYKTGSFIRVRVPRKQLSAAPKQKDQGE